MCESPYLRERIQCGRVILYLENKKLYFQPKLQKILLAGELTIKTNCSDSRSTFLGSGTVLSTSQRLFYLILKYPNEEGAFIIPTNLKD